MQANQYYLKNGALDWGYKGLCLYSAGGTRYYVKNRCLIHELEESNDPEIWNKLQT